MAILNGPVVAYATIVLFQLKKIWGLWDYRDLPLGDTPYYFALGCEWFRHRQVDFAWSPLYTAFYGSSLYFSNDAYVVTNLHRVVIVLLAVALVLAVLRRMLPHPIAWLTAAWWAVLAVNHNTQYEVHLFALLPALIAWLVILRGPGPWSRGFGLAVLLAATFLVRNELIVAVICWAGICIVFEWMVRRGTQARGDVPLARVALAYAVPVALAILLVGWFCSRSVVKFAALAAEVKLKHTLNMAQVYTFGYQQRHPEWAGDPWTQYAGICQRDFGTPLPTFTQMLRRNPRAAMAHMAWNLKLLPSGLQLLLFGVHSGSFSPDYENVLPEPVPARRNSAIVVLVVAAGLVLVWRRRRWWWDNWFRVRAAGWAAMLAIVVVACFVVPTQRPRPSYLFSPGVVLMTVVATCAFVVLATVMHRWPGAGRLATRFMPALMLVSPVIAHSPYAAGTPILARPVQKAYRELLPFQDQIRRACGVLVEEPFAEAFKSYLGQGKGVFLGYSVLQQRSPGESLAQFLDRKGISLFRIDEALWAQLEADEPGSVRGLIDTGASTGWWLIGFENTNSRWLLFSKDGPAGGVTPPGRPRDIAAGLNPPAAAAMYSGLRPLAGLGAAETVDVQLDPRVVRWGLWPATRLVPRNAAAGRFLLVMKGIAGAQGQIVTVMLDGNVVGKYPWPGTTPADVREVSVRLDLSAGWHEIELRYATSAPYEKAVRFQELRLAAD
jgi:hypothetical protein